MKIDPVKYFLWTSFFTPHCSILMQKQSVLIRIIKSNMERKLINFIEFVGNKAKVESQNGCFKETKHVKFSEKTNISKPLIRTRTCACQGVRNIRFSENLTCFVFLKQAFWNSPFCLITDDLFKDPSYSVKLKFLKIIVVNQVVFVLRKENALTVLNLIAKYSYVYWKLCKSCLYWIKTT